MGIIQFFFFFKDILAILAFDFTICILELASRFLKKDPAGILIGITLKVRKYTFIIMRTAILITMNSIIHEHGTSDNLFRLSLIFLITVL